MTFLNMLHAGINDPKDRRKFRDKWKIVDIVENLRRLAGKNDFLKLLEPQLNYFDDFLIQDEEMEADSDTDSSPVDVSGNKAFLDSVSGLLEDIKSDNNAISKIIANIIQHLKLVRRDGQAGISSWELIDLFIQSASIVPYDKSFLKYANTVCQHLLQEKQRSAPGVTPGLDVINDANMGADDKVAVLNQKLKEMAEELEAVRKAKPEPEIKIVYTTVEKIVEKIVHVQVPAGEMLEGPPAVGGGPPPPPPPIGGGPPPPPPPPGSGGGPPPPPPPPGGGGGPPPPPPPPGGGPPGPPPPPGSGPPGPPPPPGMGGPPLPPDLNMKPKKRVIKPAVKLRGLAWTKIDDKKITDTIWDNTIDDERTLKLINTSELEELFNAEQKKEEIEPANNNNNNATGDDDGKPKKKQSIQILDNKRSNNTSIMLSRFGKMAYSEIKKAIVDLDENILSAENISALKQFVPTPEEIELLKEYSGPVDQLGKPEQFFLEIMTIPRLTARLNSFHTKLTFAKKLSGIKESVSIVSDAVKEIRTSKTLPKMLELVLAVGNYLNGNTFRGGAYGFKIETLTKMVEVKAADPKLTMIHYIAQLCETKPELSPLLGMLEEFPHVTDACRESIPQALTDLNKLKGELSIVDNALKAAEADPKDVFKSQLGAFFEEQSKELEATFAFHSQLETQYKELLSYFGEIPSTDSQQLFGNFNSFIQTFDKAYKDNQRRKQLAEKAKLAEERRANQVATKGPAKAVPGGEGAGGRNMLDNIIAEMKSGRAMVPPKPRGPPQQAQQNEVANEALAVLQRLKRRNVE